MAHRAHTNIAINIATNIYTAINKHKHKHKHNYNVNTRKRDRFRVSHLGDTVSKMILTVLY